MAIQLRRGVYADFQPAKMVAGEVAVVTSGDPSTITGKAIYVCYAPGVVQRFVTDEEVVAQVDAAFVDAPHLNQTVINATNEWLDEHPEATTTVQDGSISTAKLADGAVTTPKLADRAVTSDKLGVAAVKWENLSDYCIQTSKEFSDDVVTSRVIANGAVGTAKIADGAVSDAKLAPCVFSEAETRANIDTGDTRATIFGKIKKWFTDLAPLLISSYYTSSQGAYGFSNIRIYRRGRLAQLRFWGASTLSTGSWQTIVTLPEEYRPAITGPTKIIVPQTQSSAPVMVRVTEAGELQMYPALNAPTGQIDDSYWYFIN